MNRETRRANQRALASDARPWRARARRLGPSPEDIRAIHRESELADIEMGAIRTDARAGRCRQERFDAGLDRCNRSHAAQRAIAWSDPAAAARMRAADRALDASVDATLARRSGNPGDPEVLATERAARAAWFAAADTADRAVTVAISCCARAATSRLPRSRARQRRSHRAAARPTAGGDSGDGGEPPEPEPPGSRRAAIGGAP